MVYIPLAAYEVPSSEYVILCNPSPASNVTLLLFSSDWYPIQEYKSYAPAFGDTIKTKQLRHSCRAEPVLEIGTLLGRLLFKHQQLNASPYGFASVYRQCSCVITVCTRKSPVCHKVCKRKIIFQTTRSMKILIYGHIIYWKQLQSVK